MSKTTYTMNGKEVSRALAVTMAIVAILVLAVSSAFFGLVVAGIFSLCGASATMMTGVWVGSAIAFFIDAVYRVVSKGAE